MRLSKTVLFLSAATALSCRTEEVGDAPDAAVAASTLTIKSFLATNPVTNTQVLLPSVVVVSHVSTKDDGKIWVQDAGGGASSGLMLFCDFDSMTQMCPMSRDDVDGLEIGDVISLEGQFVKVFSGRVNQMTMPRWTKRGKKTPPVAVTVDAAQVAKDAEAGARQWESVYVKIAKPATMANMMAPEFMNDRCTPPVTADAAPAADAGPATVYYNRGFEAEADGHVLAIGFKLYDTLDYCLADCGYCGEDDMIRESDSFASVSGVVYFERGGNPGINFLEIRPTTNADLPRP